MHSVNVHKDVTALEQNRRLILRIGAPLTAPDAEQIHSAIVSAWEEHPGAEAVILDLTDVSQLDSSGVGVLMELANRAEKAGVPFSICCLQEAPSRLLLRTRLDKVLRVYATVKEATAAEVPRRSRAMLAPVRKGGQIEVAARPRHSHRLLWTFILLLLLALTVAGGYGYMAVQAYQGKMTLFPAMQDNLVAAGRRIEATESALRGMNTEQNAWSKREDTRIADALRTVRQQGQEITAGREQLQAEIDGRASNLQKQVDGLQSSNEAMTGRVTNLEDQVTQLQNGQSGQTNGGEPDANNVSERVRKDFDLPLNQAEQVAPGVWIAFSSADVARQKVDGHLWVLLPGGRPVSIHGHGTDSPVPFSLKGDDKQGEVVITRVAKGGVTGYLTLPRQNAAAGE